MKKAILISGAFNPITNAHVEMGRLLHEKYPEYDIIYSVTSDEYLEGSWKGQVCYLPSTTRAKLVRQSVDSSYCKVIEESELLTDTKWTYDICSTLCNNSLNSPYNELIVCIGADKLKALNKWYKFEELLSSYNFIVFNRNHKCKFPKSLKAYKQKFTEFVLEDCYQSISSTQVRNAWFTNNLESIHNIVPLPVYNFLNYDPLFKSLVFSKNGEVLKDTLISLYDEITGKICAEKEYRVNLYRAAACLLLGLLMIPTDIDGFYEYDDRGVKFTFDLDNVMFIIYIFLDSQNTVKVRYNISEKKHNPNIESIIELLLTLHDGGIINVNKV